MKGALIRFRGANLRVMCSLFGHVLTVIAALFLFHSTAWAQEESAPKIRDLPRLRPGLPIGTIAWAVPNQLKPGQAQTGFRARDEKEEEFRELFESDNGFPKELYKHLYEQPVIAPVFIIDTPPGDSRFGHETFLGFQPDRIHSVAALSSLYRDEFGEDGMRVPQLSPKGKPMNLILVKVMGDLTGQSFAATESFLIKGKFVYLEKWSRAKGGATVIKKIKFSDLPERAVDTSDNPFRSLISFLQDDGKAPRLGTDFSQFELAKPLVYYDIVHWDEIGKNASKSDFKKAKKRAAEFFESPLGQTTVQNIRMGLGQILTCELLFGR